MNFNLEHNKKNYRILTIFITIIFILSTILPVSVNAINNEKVVPEIKVTYEGMDPSNPKVGQDFKIRYRVDPQAFYYEDSKPKEIVLVLDTSISMGKEIVCEDYNYYLCYSCKKYIDNTPEEHKNELPYVNHTITIKDRNWYYCDDCGNWIRKNQEEHRNERPYSNHLISSMKYCKEHNTDRRHYTTKIDKVKKEAEKFIDSLTSISTDKKTNKGKGLKIGIVTYDIRGYINSGQQNIEGTNRDLIELTDSDGIKKLKETINNLTTNERQRNTGDGLRKAAYMLNKDNGANKTIIFIGAGAPNAYSKFEKYNNDEYYTRIDDDNDKQNYNGNYSTREGNSPEKDGLEYAKIIGGIINEKKYNVFSIGYGLGGENSGSNQKIKEIHESMGGTESTFFPIDEGDIDKVFKKIADNMMEISFDDAKLNLNFGNEITMVSGFESTNGSTGVVKIDPIVYTKDKNNKYTAPSQVVEFTVKAKKSGEIQLIKEGSNLSYTDINGNLKEIPIKEENVTIIGTSKVIIKASDSAKTIEYDSSVKENNIDENYKLYGKSNLKIDVIGADVKYLRYRFNKNNDTQHESWKYMELNQENDIDTENEGKLTRMSYDVSHMPLRSNEEMWNNRNEVFKEPFLKDITQIKTNVSSGKRDEYVKKEEIEKENGEIVTRWNPDSLFVENYDISSYAPDYKEASKSWGYMTVPEDGEYTFKAITDDGFYGNITVDGESKVIGDAFRVKWYKDQPPASKPIKLKKGEYYPVYFEYFNWGGAACYKIECSKNGDNNRYYKEVGKMGIKFYPSKSNSPILDANNGFMGSKSIDIPTEIAKYTLEYELVDYGDDEHANSKSKYKGEFGTFEVEERFTLKKYFSQNGNAKGTELEIDKEQEFEIKYELKPKDIPKSELYKGKILNTQVNSFYLKHINLTDTLPEGLYTPITVEGNNVTKEENTKKIILSKDSLQYKLNGDNYVAESYVFTVKVKCRSNVAKKINFKKSGEISYNDVSLKDDKGISLIQKFNNELTLNIKGESEITKHGVVIQKVIKDPIKDKNEFDNLRFKKDMTYTLGFIINAKGSNNNFTVKTNDADISNMFIYELDLDGKIIDSSKKEVKDISNIGIECSKLETGKMYEVIYFAKLENPEGIANFEAKLDTGSSQNLILKFDQELPELF